MSHPYPTRDVRVAFDLLLDANRSLNGSAADCNDFRVAAAMSGRQIVASIVFQSGLKYCCMEYGCHLGTFMSPRWIRFREALVDSGVDPPTWMKLRLTIVVESGTLLPAVAAGGADQDRAGFVPHEGDVYQISAVEEKP